MNGQCVLSGCLSDTDCTGDPSGPYCDVTVGSPKLNQCTMCKIVNNNPSGVSGEVNPTDCPSSNNPVGDTGIIGKCYENSPSNTYGYCEWAPKCSSNDECNNKCCNKYSTPGPGLDEGKCESFGTVKLNKWLCKSS